MAYELPIDIAMLCSATSGEAAQIRVGCLDPRLLQLTNFHVRNLYAQMVDDLGHQSAKAQQLGAPITSAAKLSSATNQHVYVCYECFQAAHGVSTPVGAHGLPGQASTVSKVLGFIKVGPKQLFMTVPWQMQASAQGSSGRTGRTTAPGATTMAEISPLCVLDFFVYEAYRRSGVGKMLFDAACAARAVPHPALLAFDRPSKMFLGFLRKHFGLTQFVPQTNNYVLFDDYWRLADEQRRGMPLLPYWHTTDTCTATDARTHPSSAPSYSGPMATTVQIRSEQMPSVAPLPTSVQYGWGGTHLSPPERTASHVQSRAGSHAGPTSHSSAPVTGFQGTGIELGYPYGVRELTSPARRAGLGVPASEQMERQVERHGSQGHTSQPHLNGSLLGTALAGQGWDAAAAAHAYYEKNDLKGGGPGISTDPHGNTLLDRMRFLAVDAGRTGREAVSSIVHAGRRERVTDIEDKASQQLAHRRMEHTLGRTRDPYAFTGGSYISPSKLGDRPF